MREEQERKEEERRRAQEQRDVYDKYVKEMHWPKISEKKKQELEQLKMSLKVPKKSPKSHADTRNEGYMSAKTGQRANSEFNGEDSVMKKKIVWPENPLKPKPKEKKEGKIVDWLREQRLKHGQDTNTTTQSPKPNHDWKKDIEKMELQGREKYDVILDKAKEFEEKAKRKQQIIGVSKGATIEDIIELNDMYVESIKAKLELLNDIGQPKK